MINLSAETLLQGFAEYALAFARLSGFLMTMAIIGSKNFPARFRLLLALAITILVVPTLPAMPVIEIATPAGWVAMAGQSLLGVMLGFVTRLLLETFVVGAQIIAMQSGLGFASLVDPANGTSVPALGQFFLILSTLLLLAFDGHLLMLRMVIESFHTVPIGSDLHLQTVAWQLVSWGRWVFAAALLMSLVALATLLIVNISFGVMTRAAPQINVFAVGFPLTMTVGLIMVWLSLAYFVPHFENQMSRATLLICSMVNLEC